MTCDPISSLPASTSVTASLSEQVEATLLATIAVNDPSHHIVVPVGHSHPETDKSYICGRFV